MGAYKFRVVVDTEKEEDIFRDILINGDLTFENFFHAIMSAFEFEGDQLASFYLSNDDWDKGREIGLMDMGFEGDVDDSMPLVMAKTDIQSQCKEIGQKLILVYDFLRMWCFLIELLEVQEDEIESADLLLSVGTAPDELSKEVDVSEEDLGSIFLGDEEDDFQDDHFEDFESFENIDDLDI